MDGTDRTVVLMATESVCVYFCRDKGACAQCVVGKCVVAYHVPCALQHKIKFEFMETQVHTLSFGLRGAS